MAKTGVNAVRTYTVPPAWLLDAAQHHGLHVMVGIAWEQHVAFLDDAARRRSIRRRVAEAVGACNGHPAVLCYAVGNEIPAPIVRWYGAKRVARFLESLYAEAKQADPDGLVTYVNYPTTEYLQPLLHFLDFVSFNVYLEDQPRLEAYLARIHNLSADKPVVMAEIGLDSRRNGLDEQAQSLEWQIRTAFATGCAGAFAFAWSDEWHRGGHDIDDWDFGLVDRAGNPKPSLDTVRETFAQVPFPASLDWPRVSVVVCSYNGARTIRETLEAVERLHYPDYEVIVVDDGSTDATAEIAASFAGVRLIRKPNGGLSSARNVGLHASTGQIVAYLDDDAYPSVHWLQYLAAAFMRSDHVAVGGPNLAPPGDGLTAEAVAHAPGNPMHVLESDTIAEHIPGCNMAIRRDALQAIGGFDETYRIAGDDVDVCWRLQANEWKIGFSPGAVVWHHRRRTAATFWRQQKNYGKAEALLELKWPQKYNIAGHLRWKGRVYLGGMPLHSMFRRWRVYHGQWGSGLFQSVYAPADGFVASLPSMPEWYVLILSLALISAAGLVWAPLLWTLPLLGAAIAVSLFRAIRPALRVRKPAAVRFRIALMHLLQPLARLVGRVSHGLTPWRPRGKGALHFVRPISVSIWSEQWRSLESWLGRLEAALVEHGLHVQRGHDYAAWDLDAHGGLFGAARIRAAIEEHGGGRQLIRFRIRPRFAPTVWVPMVLFGVLGTTALVAGASLAGGILLFPGVAAFVRAWRDCGAAQNGVVCAAEVLNGGE